MFDTGYDEITPFDPRLNPRRAPTTGIFDAPYSCVQINQNWLAHLIGVVERLDRANAWLGTDDEVWRARQEVRKLIALLQAGDPCPSDHCRTYLPTAPIVNYGPVSPYDDPQTTPGNFTQYPWRLVGTEIGDQLLGYQPGDVLATVPPIVPPYQSIRITANMSSSGTVEIDFINVPGGGRAMIVVDSSINPLDWVYVELARDGISIPPENTVIVVQELPLNAGLHTIDITFLPVVNDELTVIQFGGGIRSIEICEDTMPSQDPCCPQTNDLLSEMLARMRADNQAVISNSYNTSITNKSIYNQNLLNMYDGTIGSIAPGASATPALPDRCTAIRAFVLAVLQNATAATLAQGAIDSGAAAALQALLTSGVGPALFIATSTAINMIAFVLTSDEIAALSDQDAIDELVCAIDDGLGSPVSESAFKSALDSTSGLSNNATLLSGVLKRMMQSRENYLHFLKTLETSTVQGGTDEDCGCNCSNVRIEPIILNNDENWTYVRLLEPTITYNAQTFVHTVTAGRYKQTRWDNQVVRIFDYCQIKLNCCSILSMQGWEGGVSWSRTDCNNQQFGGVGGLQQSSASVLIRVDSVAVSESAPAVIGQWVIG